MVNSLVAKKSNVRIGVVQFGGLGKEKLALTPILNSDGTVNQANVAKIKNAILADKISGLNNNSFQYGIGWGSAGTNIEAGLIQGNKTLYPTSDSGSNNKKYMILLSDGEPNVYGINGDQYGAGQNGSAAQAAIRQATSIKNSHPENFGLYTVGFATDIACLKNIASSPSNYYYAVGADLGNIFGEILESILWVINNGTVVDTMGAKVDLITSEDNIVITPTVLDPTATLPSPVQPSVSTGSSGKVVTWNTGSYVSDSATMTYTVKLKSSEITNATGDSVSVPLNDSAVLTYTNKDGQTRALNFPVPTAEIEIGTLSVTSTGLPAGVTGTTQSIGNTLVGNASFPQTPYTVTAPIAAPSGYELKSVKVNGADMSKTAFDAAYLKSGVYQLPVKKGAQTVEYCYGPISVHTVHIEKYDGNNAALSGAVFTIDQEIGTKAANQGTDENKTYDMSFTYGVNYTVTESTTPTSFYGVAAFTVTLNAAGTGLEFVGTAPSGVTLDGLTIKVANSKINDLSYTVEHYYDGETEPFDTDAVNNVSYGTEVTAVDDSDLLTAGYVRTSVATLPATIT
ncbi:MAG: VWA domain-containing protein, partial [Oscillospiraceae bacterium]|nr:VWA domain-containing protein [Oscillospiraceae bacterium]